MAAQERAKQAQNPPSQTPDLLSDAPPAFDATVLPPPSQEQPPVFDDSFLPPPPAQPQQTSAFSWDPHAPESSFPLAPPAASAPDIDDLLAFEAPLPTNDYQTSAASKDNDNEEVLAAILAMEGLSEADKQALIEEQMKIMASIEKSRTNDRASAAHSAADAFESRSFSNNVQSVNNPSRRFHSSTVSAKSAEEAAQLKADMELAEALQKEEYAQAEQQQTRQRSRATPPAPAPAPQESQSWLEWLGMSSSTATPTTRSGDAPPPYSAPGQNAVSSGRGSYDEDEAFLRNRPRARVAESQPLFACVTDSVSSALTYAVSPPPDGVDSSSLLAMPQVGRNNEYERPN